MDELTTAGTECELVGVERRLFEERSREGDELECAGKDGDGEEEEAIITNDELVSFIQAATLS